MNFIICETVFWVEKKTNSYGQKCCRWFQILYIVQNSFVWLGISLYGLEYYMTSKIFYNV